ncbi:MAG: 50S ribosomal protein L17 [Verrucomicrobiaceae bacterium]|jgi:large subunit ribosomal protein L17|nr:50S ribosomal protein L17 [Verrucomicrobiaceae bacterium]
MRHKKHRHQLGVKKEHRQAIMASLASALFRHDKIQTTLGYAKALRPFAEKMITLAKKAAATDDTAKKLHFRRQALAKIRDVSAVHFLFAEKVSKFLKREGGYTRIYKLVPRIGDAADMAIIELIEADDQGYKAQPKKAVKAEEAPKAEEAVAEEAAEEKKPAKKAATKKATKKAATKKVAKKKASAEETKE